MRWRSASTCQSLPSKGSSWLPSQITKAKSTANLPAMSRARKAHPPSTTSINLDLSPRTPAAIRNCLSATLNWRMSIKICSDKGQPCCRWRGRAAVGAEVRPLRVKIKRFSSVDLCCVLFGGKLPARSDGAASQAASLRKGMVLEFLYMIWIKLASQQLLSSLNINSRDGS